MAIDEKRVKALAKAEERMYHCDFCPYLDLKALLRDRSADAKARFSELFMTYYQLRTGGLSDSFTARYFSILFGNSVLVDGKPDLEPILKELRRFKGRNSKHALHFSFVSKLAAMHDESSPIFDRYVLAFFGEVIPSSSVPVQTRITWFVNFLAKVKEGYQAWALESSVEIILGRLRARDKGLSQCHTNRLLDFLVWKVGNQRLLRP